METLTCIALAHELHRLLRGTRVRGVEQGDAGETLLIHLKKTSDAAAGSGWLVLSTCAGESTLFFCARKPQISGRLWPAPLSAHIDGAAVRSVSHRGMDRTLALSLRSARKKDEEATLLVELFAPRPRAYLIDPGTYEVISSFGGRRAASAGGGRRAAGPGEEPCLNAYTPPAPPRDKVDPFALSAEALAESLPAAVTEADLVEKIFGIGGVLAREVVTRAGSSGSRAAEVLEELISSAADGGAQGYLVLPAPARADGGVRRAGEDAEKAGREGPADEGEDTAASASSRERFAMAPAALTFEPSSPAPVAVRRCATVNDALRQCFHSCRRLAGELERRRRAARGIRTELKRTARTRRVLMEELGDARGADEHRRMGELILANIGKIARGISEIELPDPERDGVKLRVALDARLSPAENAALHFKRARKLKKKLALLPRRIDELARRERELASELERLEAGRSRPAARPPSAGGRAGTARGGKWPAGVSPREFASSDGWIMYVGRNNKENDYLTFSFAKPDDLWFHAQGVPGSHVVLRREGRKAKPSRRCVEETASVAAYFSKGRTSQTVAVIYTERRYVRKPRKGKPGTALCSRERTVMVSPRLPREPGRGCAR